MDPVKVKAWVVAEHNAADALIGLHERIGSGFCKVLEALFNCCPIAAGWFKGCGWQQEGSALNSIGSSSMGLACGMGRRRCLAMSPSRLEDWRGPLLPNPVAEL